MPFHRSSFFLYLFGGLSLVYAGESLLFTCLLNEVVPWYYPVIGIFSDLFWPVAFLLCLLFSGWMIFPVLIALSFAFLFFVKTTNIFFFLNLFEILTFSNFSLIMEHTDSTSLRLEFGPFYLLKIGGIVLSFTAGILLIIFAGCRSRKALSAHRTYNGLKAGLMFFLLLSVAANVIYQIWAEEFGRYFFQRDFSARPIEQQMRDFYFDFNRQVRTEKVEYVFPKAFSAQSEAVLKSWGVLPFPQKFEAAPIDPGFRKIIILVVESLNYDYLRSANPQMPPDITPFLDRLSRDYVSFKNYYTGSQPTSWALDCIFLSRMDFLRDLTMQHTSLCDILRKQGWKTWYFSPTMGMCYNNGRDYAAAFRPDHVMFQEQLFEKFGVKGSHYWGIGDDELLDCVFRTMKEAGPEPALYVISTIDLHDPYTVTGPAKDLPSTGNRFLDSLRGVDRNVEHFLTRVMNDPLFDEETLIIVTADHSATFGANYTHRKDFLPDRIPLILLTRGNRLNGLFDPERLGSQIDLAPTILSLLGIPAPESFMGRDLRQPGKLFALSKTVDMIRICLPKNQKYSCIFGPAAPSTKEERALLELYQHFYGKEKRH